MGTKKEEQREWTGKQYYEKIGKGEGIRQETIREGKAR